MFAQSVEEVVEIDSFLLVAGCHVRQLNNRQGIVSGADSFVAKNSGSLNEPNLTAARAGKCLPAARLGRANGGRVGHAIR